MRTWVDSQSFLYPSQPLAEHPAHSRWSTNVYYLTNGIGFYVAIVHFPFTYTHDISALPKPKSRPFQIHGIFDEPTHVAGPVDSMLSKTHRLQDSSNESVKKKNLLKK